MKLVLIVIIILVSFKVDAQIPVKWEELAAPEFSEAVSKAGKVCVVPLGIVEKHGPSLPLGTDLMIVRDVVLKAAQKEYVVVFPEFYVGQINEARHQPGTISYSPELVWRVLEETCNEIARNGFEKIILVNGHGGNNSMLSYFAIAMLNKRHSFAIYFANGWDIYANKKDKELVDEQIQLLPDGSLGHAGADEAAEIKMIRPDLFKPERAITESGVNLQKVGHLTNVSTGIDWYASFPNHYAGNAANATTQLGEAMLYATVNGLAKVFGQVKTDTEVLKLQKQFFDEADQPLKTRQ